MNNERRYKPEYDRTSLGPRRTAQEWADQLDWMEMPNITLLPMFVAGLNGKWPSMWPTPSAADVRHWAHLEESTPKLIAALEKTIEELMGGLTECHDVTPAGYERRGMMYAAGRIRAALERTGHQ